MVKNEGDNLKKVVVCSPKSEYFKVKDLTTHNFITYPEPNQTKREHDRLRSILKGFGSEVINIPELPGHPNSVFTRDTSICTPEGYVKLRMGLESRRGEGEWMSEILDSFGEHRAGIIKEPGTVEGGDIILGGEVAFISLSNRTNEEGAGKVTELLMGMNYEVRTINLPKPFLHIGGAMSIIGRGCVLCCEGVFPEEYFEGFEVIKISSDKFITGNVITLGDGEVIVEVKNFPVIKKLKEKGFKVHTIELSEFIKGGGGPSCLTLPIERE